ncbi:Rhodanese- sulfurtransferase [Loxospora ochrophaea]|nr:Rhodanese- sulfurtransferase [Loxospora ochrophaea]
MDLDVTPHKEVVPNGLPSNNSPQLPVTVTKPIPYTFDLGNLLCYDSNPLPPKPTEPHLAATARDAAQGLINQLLTTCPITAHPSSGVLISLPAPSTPLPREKPLPKPKEETKWEKFAKKKGIKGKRRGESGGKTVYDEEKGEWVPKWGYKGKNKEGEGDWIVEVDEKKERERAEEGPSGVRSEGRRERMEKVRRNERKQRANQRNQRKSNG